MSRQWRCNSGFATTGLAAYNVQLSCCEPIFPNPVNRLRFHGVYLVQALHCPPSAAALPILRYSFASPANSRFGPQKRHPAIHSQALPCSGLVCYFSPSIRQERRFFEPRAPASAGALHLCVMGSRPPMLAQSISSMDLKRIRRRRPTRAVVSVPSLISFQKESYCQGPLACAQSVR